MAYLKFVAAPAGQPAIAVPRVRAPVRRGARPTSRRRPHLLAPALVAAPALAGGSLATHAFGTILIGIVAGGLAALLAITLGQAARPGPRRNISEI